MIIESNFVQAKSREKAEVLYICVSFWLLALESHDFSQDLNLRQNQLLLQAEHINFFSDKMVRFKKIII